MKSASLKPKSKSTTLKTVSLPTDLYTQVVERRIQVNPELDFSKYIRSLIRRDLVSKSLAA